DLLSEDAKTILQILSVFPSSISRAAIAIITELGLAEVDRAITQLRRLSLVKDAEPNRFTLLRLTRDFLQWELMRSGSYSEDRFFSNAVQYYLDLCRQNAKNNKRLKLARENVLAVIDWCMRREQWENVIELMKL